MSLYFEVNYLSDEDKIEIICNKIDEIEKDIKKLQKELEEKNEMSIL